MTDTKRYWFGPKHIGIGISPRSWQGWASMAVYVLLIALLRQLLPPTEHRIAFWGGFAGITIALGLLVTVTYGPRSPR